ncbi:hypothetical protein OOZ15_09745 [Galbibacter sp. EGI 63066]|uniref:hypothetical protein n=1 Tax=Galbibacter sp. EGI 63066 TaxID=2993559 RepID=UPI00224971B1|nr:hypothetical protein [Galbibacter sp. EGI 63066]MCX2680220.1 hypothetical protein [Galbibacter sp. EGI 63066]
MLNLISYIRYLFKSVNQHGVHSPFVYNLLIKALYKKQKLVLHSQVIQWKNQYGLSKRKQRIINSAVVYFNDQNFKEQHDNAFKIKNTAYFSLGDIDLETVIGAVNTYSFFIIDNLNQSKETAEKWDRLKKSNRFNVSIDFYSLGFIFIRKGQNKEDFIIRV